MEKLEQNKNILRLKTFKKRKQPPDVFYRKGILKFLAKFTGKHLYQSLRVQIPEPQSWGLQLY